MTVAVYLPLRAIGRPVHRPMVVADRAAPMAVAVPGVATAEFVTVARAWL